jgi:hypothetical protein
MASVTFLEHYRVCLSYDGTPNELGRDGDAIAYEAVDERSREGVVVTLVPVESIDPAVREQFEEQARAVERLRHVNIAKVFDFGREGENYVYVSERLSGETLDAWVAQHGPMPADATLRVAEQIVSVLSSATFHKLPCPAIGPSDIVVVPGQTPEGGWPLIKLNNFGLASVESNPKASPEGEHSPPGMPAEPKKASVHEQAPSTEQHAVAESGKPSERHGMTDFGSQIYSLGTTMYFLLTGAALSAKAAEQPLHFVGFPKPLRNLLGRMLHPDSAKRPKDLVTLAEMIRGCLLKIERRLVLADKYGIPFRTTIRQPTEARPRHLLRTALAVGALILAAAVIAPLLFPVPIGGLLHRPRETKTIGVLVGVPEPSPTPAVAQNVLPPTDPATVLSQAASPFTNQPATNSASAPDSSQAASPNPQQAEASTAQTQPAVTPPSPAGQTPEASVESEAGKSSANAFEAAQSSTSSQAASRSKKKRVASRSSPRERSVRVRMVGITSDGRLIYRLPSGRTRIVAPDSDQDNVVPRRNRRAFMQPDQTFAPPPQFGPDYFPYD